MSSPLAFVQLESLQLPGFWLKLFCVLWLHRYVRLLVNCVSHWRYRSVPLPDKPTYGPHDVTVIIPTIHNAFEELRPSLLSILACQPYELVLVTTADKEHKLVEVTQTLGYKNIRVLSTPVANKRLQVCQALPDVKTRITVMADDDVTWQPTMMPWLLAPFEDQDVGGVGTCQRVKRVLEGTLQSRIFNWLGAVYIERRNFEITATHNIDGGTSCMSGRTGAYRSAILYDFDFLHGFRTEKWGSYILNADDDNFVTRWLVYKGWKTWIQYEPECEVETTLENSPKFLYQCSRWARSNWRSNWTSLVRERYVWTQQPWCTYALHIATFTSLAFLVDPLLLLSLWWGTAEWAESSRRHAFWSQVVFMFGFTKVVKLVGLLGKNPRDLVFLPVTIAFGYFHGLIKLYALFTLRMTSWGSRPDADANNDYRMMAKPKRSDNITTPRGRGIIQFRDRQNPQTTERFRDSGTEKRAFAESIDSLINVPNGR